MILLKTPFRLARVLFLTKKLISQLQATRQHRLFFNISDDNRKKEYCEKQLVGYSTDQMYDVVSDVENYYKFIPLCNQSNVFERTPGNLKAILSVGYPPIIEHYTSTVTLEKPYLVEAKVIDCTIFHYLNSIWRFSDSKTGEQSCVVDFKMSFEFRSVYYLSFPDIIMAQIAKRMKKAFFNEAERRYGPATMRPLNLLDNSIMKC